MSGVGSAEGDVGPKYRSAEWVWWANGPPTGGPDSARPPSDTRPLPETAVTIAIAVATAAAVAIHEKRAGVRIEPPRAEYVLLYPADRAPTHARTTVVRRVANRLNLVERGSGIDALSRAGAGPAAGVPLDPIRTAR